jgi:hypothetical protein
VDWSAGGWVLNTSTSAGTGNGYWNGLQVQFNRGSFLFGAASAICGRFLRKWPILGWTIILVCIRLTLVMLPHRTPFTVDIFQFENGIPLTGEATALTWNGRT